MFSYYFLRVHLLYLSILLTIYSFIHYYFHHYFIIDFEIRIINPIIYQSHSLFIYLWYILYTFNSLIHHYFHFFLYRFRDQNLIDMLLLASIILFMPDFTITFILLITHFIHHAILLFYFILFILRYWDQNHWSIYSPIYLFIYSTNSLFSFLYFNIWTFFPFRFSDQNHSNHHLNHLFIYLLTFLMLYPLLFSPSQI